MWRHKPGSFPMTFPPSGMTPKVLLFAAVRYSYELIERRFAEQVGRTAGVPRDIVLVLLELLLGGDEVVRDAIRVNVAFGSRTQNEARIRDLLTEGDVEITDLCEGVIAQAKAAGDVASDVDPVQEAQVLFAVATGLGTRVAVYGWPAAAAKATFDYYTARLGIVC